MIPQGCCNQRTPWHHPRACQRCGGQFRAVGQCHGKVVSTLGGQRIHGVQHRARNHSVCGHYVGCPLGDACQFYIAVLLAVACRRHASAGLDKMAKVADYLAGTLAAGLRHSLFRAQDRGVR